MPPMKLPTGLGKNFPGRYGSSSKPAPSGVKRLYLLYPAAAPEVTKGRYAPDRARISLRAIWTSSFRIFSSRLLSSPCSIKLRQHSDPGKTLRSGAQPSFPEWSIHRFFPAKVVAAPVDGDGGDMAARQNSSNMLQTIAAAITCFMCFAFENRAESFIRLVLEKVVLAGNPAEQRERPLTARPCSVHSSHPWEMIESRHVSAHFIHRIGAGCNLSSGLRDWKNGPY